MVGQRLGVREKAFLLLKGLVETQNDLHQERYTLGSRERERESLNQLKKEKNVHMGKIYELAKTLDQLPSCGIISEIARIHKALPIQHQPLGRH